MKTWTQTGFYNFIILYLCPAHSADTAAWQIVYPETLHDDDDGPVASDMPGPHLHPPSPYLPLITADRRIGAGWCSSYRQLSAVVYLDKAAVTCGHWSPPWSPHPHGCWSQAASDTWPGTGQGEVAKHLLCMLL